MSELSAAARALIRDGQSVLRPSAVDRARVGSALASRLGEGALVASSAAVVSRWLPWQKVSGLVVGVGLVGLGAAWGLREPAPVEEAPMPSAPVLVASEPSPVLPPAEVPDAPPGSPEGATPTPHAPPVKLAPAADRLAEEVAILSRATSELRGGKPADALRLLNEHQQRFPGGRLVEERRAARIQALCALGNRAAAESELARLARSSPRSPHLARAQQACGIPKSGG